MKRKNLLSGVVALVLTASPVMETAPLLVYAEHADQIYSVNSPTEDRKIEFWLDEEGTPYYQVVSHGTELIEDAKLGLNTSLGSLDSGLTVVGSPNQTSSDTVWNPVVGEQEEIRDHYNELTVTLSHEETDLEFELVMRAYDEGVAFRYMLPDVPDDKESYTILDEYTQFTFAAGAKASLHKGGNQTVPVEYAVENLPAGTIQRPATIQYSDGQMMTICEGNLDNYSVMTLAKSTKDRTLEANYAGNVTVSKTEGPDASPWRVLVIGSEPTELLENDTIIQNLNEPADEDTYDYSSWVDPGSCVRATTGMNNDAIKKVIDLAAEHGIRYVLLDSGWYGPEYDKNADPRLDPTALDPENEQDKILLEKYFATEGGYNNTGEGVFNTRGVGFNQYGKLGDGGSMQVNVDIPALCDYGKDKNVGIILYVNGVFFPDSSGRNRFNADELFTYYEKWGVAGVKPGFVNCRTQAAEKHMEYVIESAAKHKLVLTIHDEYVPSGLERTYPNLMMTEGILGDESIGRTTPQVAEDIATLFTRNVQGPPDHTFCYPGKATKAYALASPLMFRSGMSVIYWYTNPGMAPEQDKDKLGIWDNLPTNWKKSLYLEGSLYEYATTARKSYDDVWYVGSLSAVTRTLKLSLDFLDKDVTYVADVYADGVDADPYVGWTTSATAEKSKQTLENKKYLVTSETVLQRNLEYGFGYAVILKEATEEDLAAYPSYHADRQELELELERAALIEKGTYTEESWTAFETAYTAAQAVKDQSDAADEQMRTATENLKNAREALVSTGLLEDAIGKAELYTSYHYTEESFAALAAALKDAKELLEGETFDQDDLDQAEQAITTAIQGLKDDPNRVIKKTVYLDELDYDKTQSYAYSGAIKKNVDYSGGDLTLMVDGQETSFSHGLLTHAQAEVYYDIEGLGLETFQAYVGIDTAKPSQGNVIFRVYGDDQLLYESEPSGNGSQEAQFFNIPIAGVKKLRIEANMNGSNDGDHAVWGDAKFLTYRDPSIYLEGILINGESLTGFSQDCDRYYYPVQTGEAVPVIDAVPAEADIVYEVQDADKIPGCTKVNVTKQDGSIRTYRIYLLSTEDADYLSDLPNSRITKNTVHGLTKDTAYSGAELAITASDGQSKLSFKKGIGTHASSSTDSMVVYDIADLGYDRFTGYVGISYAKRTDTRANVNFKIYVDDEAEPRFVSGTMGSTTPAVSYDVDVRGAKTLTLVADACGDQSADHGCWCDAKFLKYEGIQKVSGTVDVADTGLEKQGIKVELYENADGNLAKNPTDTVLTDMDGTYCFESVLLGTYFVKIQAGVNHYETVEEITVLDEAIVQDLTLTAPEYEIAVIQPEDAIVVADHTFAVLNEEITLYVKEIKTGKTASDVMVVGKDGTQIETKAVENKKDCYTFVMPQQKVTITVTLKEDVLYQEASARAAVLDEKITAIGEVSLEKRTQIEAIRAEYEQLSEMAKELVQNLEQLEHCERMLEALSTNQETVEAKNAAEAAETAAKAAETAAKTAQNDAEAAQEKAETAAKAAETAQKEAEAAQIKAEEAKAAAEAAKLSTAQDKQAAEAAEAAADQAAKEAEAAWKNAETAQKAAETAQKEAASAQEKAETARESANAAQKAAEAAAEAAQNANEEAAKEAKQAAEAAKKTAEEYQKAVEEAKKAAEEANKSAEESTKATEAAQVAADYAAQVAEAQAKAQTAQEKAEIAQKAAEEAEKKAEQDKLAAEEAKKAAEEAQKKAEAAQAAAELTMEKQQAMFAVAREMDKADQKDFGPNQQKAYDMAVEDAVRAISEAETKAELQTILEELNKAIEDVEHAVSADRFADITAGDWFYEVVDYVAFNGLMTGIDEDNFGPCMSLSRAQFAVILYRMDGEPMIKTDHTFDDVENDAWYGAAVLWAAENGIIYGYEDGRFGPADLITREQLAVMMYRYADYRGIDCDRKGDISSFEDAEAVSEFAQDAVRWAYAAGILTGKEDGTRLDPQGMSARVEAAAIIERFLNLD